MKKLHLVCNSHIDPVWLWNKDEGINAALSTFTSAIRLLEEKRYIFCHNESILYEYVEKVAPDLFKKIKEHVQKGDWQIIGGWYIQPDCLMPAGETFVRNTRIGKRYFKEKFGIEPTIAVNFDAFGHSVGLVQILTKSGYNGYVLCRPHFDMWKVDSDWFDWRGLDGSKLKVIHEKFHYSSEMGKIKEKIADEIAYYDEKGKDVGLCLWGVGNHGGGPSEQDLCDIEELQKTQPVELVHSTLETAFAEVTSTTEYSQSLVTVMPGCYTSNQALKKKYVDLETKLFYLEKLATVAEAFYDIEYPMESLKSAWKDLLLSSFHDILPGTCAESGIINAEKTLGHGLYEVEERIAEIFSALSFSLKKSANGKIPLCVFNPFPYELETIVEGEFILPKIYFLKGERCKLNVTDSFGNVVDSQTIKESANFNVDWQKRVAFKCILKPFEIAKFDVSYEIESKEKELLGQATTPFLENLSLCVYEDNEDPWGMAKKQLIQMGERPQEIQRKSCRIIEDGCLFEIRESEYAYGCSKIVLKEKKYKKSDIVDLDLRVYWNEENKLLKLHLGGYDGEYIGQVPFGTETLFSDGRECCAQRFVGTQKNGFINAVFNDGVYGSSYKDGVIMISLLRSGAYAAHPATDPETGVVRPLVANDRFIPHFGQGLHTYSFRLQKVKEDELERCADEFIQKPYVVNIFPCGTHEAIQPQIFISNKNITLKALKKAEDVNGYIVRLLNNTSERKTATVHFGNAEIALSFGKYEVKTVVFTKDTAYEEQLLII